jgi:hypothetical protein
MDKPVKHSKNRGKYPRLSYDQFGETLEYLNSGGDIGDLPDPGFAFFEKYPQYKPDK